VSTSCVFNAYVLDFCLRFVTQPLVSSCRLCARDATCDVARTRTMCGSGLTIAAAAGQITAPATTNPLMMRIVKAKVLFG